MKRFLQWLEDRTAYRKLLGAALDEPVLGGASWAYVFGSALAFLFVLQAVTGVLMALYYSPSSREAWGSVYFFSHVIRFGWFVRGLHHFGSSAMVVLLIAHMFQVFIFGADRPPRELSWWTGVVLLFTALAFSLTGYLLPWDQKGYWATGVVTSIIGTFPLIGHSIQHVFQGGNGLGNLTLTRFFGFHVFFLPAVLTAMLVSHIYFFRRNGVTPKWWQSQPDQVARSEPFWPRQLTYDLLFSFLILGVLVTITLSEHGAPLDAPADPSSHYLARPEWYFLWLFEMLKVVPGKWEGAFVLAFVVAGVSFLLALPLVDRSVERSFRARWPHFVVASIFGGTVAALTVNPLVRDARDPAVRIQKQQAEASAKSAFMLAAKGIPPGGSDQLYLNDPRSRGAHLFAQQCEACHTGPDGKGGDTAPILRGYLTRDWVRGVINDPTTPAYFGRTKMKTMQPPDATSAEIDELTTYVMSLGGRAQAPPGGPKLFEVQSCHSCHPLAGEPPHIGPSLAGYGSRAWIVGAILHSGDATYYGDSNAMPSFSGKLNDEQVDDLLAYLVPQVESPVGSLRK